MLPGGLPASPPAVAQPQPGGSRDWREGKLGWMVEEGALPAAIEPCLAAQIPETRVTPCRTRPRVPAPFPSTGAGCSLGHCCPLPPPFWVPANCWVQTVCGKKKMLDFLLWCWWLLVLLQRGMQAPSWHWDWHQHHPSATGQL